ncbi:Uncharacterised protein (plasmid) [Tsukamurella tyrosinosolvens]|uniref:Uncharacterized protein n=1 Tax=Tsukamurella tyrosinosolvens TaxID=57704 RepID=A0A1H4V515_TSUTY|nr:hypothetical protein AXK58_21750 [Tsukamurella tyrosinosolvens]SEC75611.1 hypothetical protein SAMN04489793_3131 [Tsukamurella tyrosinosolvens]VEH90702.1 Uncharacterised protein [Tsukamurella tyrosinosolvens]
MRIRTDFKASTRAMAGGLAYHASESESKAALAQIGPGDTYAETWIRDHPDSNWRLESVEHLGHTERTSA